MTFDRKLFSPFSNPKSISQQHELNARNLVVLRTRLLRNFANYRWLCSSLEILLGFPQTKKVPINSDALLQEHNLCQLNLWRFLIRISFCNADVLERMPTKNWESRWLPINKIVTSPICAFFPGYRIVISIYVHRHFRAFGMPSPYHSSMTILIVVLLSREH